MTSSTIAFNPVSAELKAWRPTRARFSNSSTSRPISACQPECDRGSAGRRIKGGTEFFHQHLENPLICRKGARRSWETE